MSAVSWMDSLGLFASRLVDFGGTPSFDGATADWAARKFETGSETIAFYLQGDPEGT